jgi:hypothetical protein
MVSSFPTFVEFFHSKQYGVPYGQSKEAKQQDDLWKKNLKCTAAPMDGLTTASNVVVDATICRSGDVLVRINTPDNRNFYKWVSVDAVIEQASSTFINEAFASYSSNQLMLAQSNYSVICQRFLGSGELLRRIRDRDGNCFDEIINTYTGAVISSKPAPCNSQC